MNTLFFDSHCHIHQSVNLDDLSQAIMQRLKSSHLGLCLVELAGSTWFEKIYSGSCELSGFELEKLDPVTLRVSSGEYQAIIVKGEQVNTEERLEVVVMGCPDVIAEGQKLDWYLKTYSSDYLVVIPWGVGKWLGPRGEAVSKVIEEREQTGFNFALGDNGGRPSWWKVPQFSLAEKKSVPVLAGSDPLNVSSYGKRVLAYGDQYKAELFGDSGCWIEHVKSGNESGVHAGNLSSTVQFLIDQIGLRIKKFM